MEFTIRKAKEKDLEQLYNLVKELAIYEKEPDAVTASMADYKESFKLGEFEAIVADFQGDIAGMALFYTTFSTWKGRMLYLEDFVVNNKYRRTGIGQQLFDAFLEEGRLRKARLVKWQVLDWNEPALHFYKKNEAIIEKEWWNGKIFLS